MPRRKIPTCAICRRDETQVQTLILCIAGDRGGHVCGDCGAQIADALFLAENPSPIDRERAWGERLMARAADQLEAERTAVEFEPHEEKPPRLYYWQRGAMG